MEPKLLKAIADFFAMTVDQLRNQDHELLKDLYRQWQDDEFSKVHSLGYQIIR